jgi:hypothetical protein
VYNFEFFIYISTIADTVSSTVETEVIQEVVLNSLLALVDIPLLDDILHYLAAAPSNERDGFSHWEPVCKAPFDADDWR